LPIPTTVKPVLAHAIAWKASDRYESIQAFCEALRQAREQADHESATAPTGDDEESSKRRETKPTASSDAPRSADDAARSGALSEEKRDQAQVQTSRTHCPKMT
jgi:hypothetical protein